MPAFQNPQGGVGIKRKNEIHDPNISGRKRQATEDDSIVSGHGRAAGETSAGMKYWFVVWRNPQYKKHKTWDGDAVLVVGDPSCTLYDMDGKLLVSGRPHGIEGLHQITEGANFTVGGKELEVDRPMDRSEFYRGTCFSKNAMTSPLLVPPISGASSRQFTPLRPKALSSFKPPTMTSNTATSKRGIELEPINLVASGETPLKQKAHDSSWTVNWRKPQQRKHKTWDGDAFLTLRGEKLTLISEKGLILGHKSWDGIRIHTGYSAFIGGREIEVDSQISLSELPTIVGASDESSVDPLISTPPRSQTRESFLLSVRRSSEQPQSEDNSPGSSVSAAQKYIPPTSFYGKGTAQPKPKGPLHDPKAEGAVVMKAPSKEHAAKHNKKNLPVVDVVVDPILARHLRPHQVEGVKFLYECVIGLRKHEGYGCILADEMGMGKTLQTITLCWTLLKQNPYASGNPVVGKILIVCPVTLISNWKNEFHKWLGKDRVGIFVGDKDKAVIKQFINS
ncbi:uncharacterized protein FIBRA_06542 [Fibroporia radiculosa]|uniref:Helicase ATP-binding domain-containing protein n=1 Tax=Fibroporia radiculosa TaxID=599839 RepID=J4H448_9APHY|nr:uncharacterized protein FIBRA_06542 [Fibroporia radiculosa]CCM04369.1 predicted protein [Fibroporia radiculosa]